MSAHFIDLEQVHLVCFLGQVELPDTVNLASKAVHWLVSADKSGQGCKHEMPAASFIILLCFH